MTRDHLIPKSKGGGAGTVPACHDCNRDKADLMPLEYAADPRLMRLLYDRRQLVTLGVYVPRVVCASAPECGPPSRSEQRHQRREREPVKLRLPKYKRAFVGRGCAPFATFH